MQQKFMTREIVRGIYSKAKQGRARQNRAEQGKPRWFEVGMAMRLMDGTIDEWMNVVDGWMDALVDEWVDGWVDG